MGGGKRYSEKKKKLRVQMAKGMATKKKKSIAAHMKCRQGYQMIIQNI